MRSLLLLALAACGDDDAHGRDAAADGAIDAAPDAAATCGPTDAPGTDECPDACTGGCDAAHVCTIECSGAGTCSGDAIVCPADYACLVRCIGLDACDSGRIDCPDAYPCTIVCDGVDGCGDQSIHCGRGPCEVQCGTNREACTGMNVHCGTGPCAATCAGTSGPFDMIDCETSCSCTECEEGSDADAGTDAGADPDAGVDSACDPNPCTDPDKTICGVVEGEVACACDVGFTDDGAGACVPASGATFDEVTQWVDDYQQDHPGRDGDVLGKTPAELAADPDALRLLSICGPDQRPVIPRLAWEYGGNDHAWIAPEEGALVYCVYVPVDPGTDHWSYVDADDHVTADVYVLFPDQNPCGGLTGAEVVTGCIGDDSNFEILVDTASLDDGHGAGLELSEASTELRLLPADGGPAIHLWDDV